MNTTAPNSTLASAQSADEATLGWNTMPAYGEVMSDLYGAQYVALEAPAPRCPAPAAPTNLFLENFWSTVRNQFIAMAA